MNPRAYAVGLALLGLVSCAPLFHAAPSPPMVLRIGTYFDNPPFEFISGGAEAGFEIDLMKEIAARLGRRPEFVGTRWERILRETQEGRYDCIVGGITITPAREKILSWSAPYLTTTLSLVTDARRNPAIRGIGDLKGASVGVQAATTDYDVALRMRAEGEIGKVGVYPSTASRTPCATSAPAGSPR
ncbi:substrate-binding periplasmic protein [Nonomuraea zeae]|uniref:Amino acid ABC transporter substrate-binding protein n=1 Tax=Nonomuraea zeae TaxID=1642303 RepID=A0A5S4GUR2_9ACTN|nr:ABC transporter substrate-binding protein [Nonomuraea zeae]TMR36695.1 amino acid ABC transporter substrate-binding protein [Nonomuraea zeae]